MASLIYQPPAGGALTQEVRVTAGTVIYTFTAGIPKDVAPEHVAAVTTALQAAEGTIPTPAAPVVTLQGASGSTTYGYKIAAVGVNGDTTQSPETQITTGNASLAAGNGNVVTWTAPAALGGAVTGYKVIRSTGGATQGLVGTVAATALTFTDTGVAASVYTPAVSNPGQVGVATGPGEL